MPNKAVLDLGCFEISEGTEGAIGDAVVGKRPQAFTGVQFRRIGWQEEQVDALGHEPNAFLLQTDIWRECLSP